jgi:hypothetical protein
MIETSRSLGTILLNDLWANHATYKPGELATLHLSVNNTKSVPQYVLVVITVQWLDQTILSYQQQVDLAAGTQELHYPLALPRESFRGYGVDVSLVAEDERVLAQRSIALDVLEDWTQAPRYGFLSDFLPGSDNAEAHVAALARYHVNVVQYYDWMWRHYDLLPREDTFVDGCGRTLSLLAVRKNIAACQQRGMASMGYAAVYGAEPEYALAHPEQMLYDEKGEPYSLEKLFYIMNIHEGNPWREQILTTMAEAVQKVPFDGLHLDQYGFPKENVFGPQPERVAYDLEEDFPSFIDAARAAIRQAAPGTRVIFNAVENWPIKTVAPTSQDATYIEVWPPYTSYLALQKLILAAQRLAPTKQVILAAYMKPLQHATGDDLLKAEAATLLTSATIWASGGFHLLMGEQDGALCHPYYPEYAPLRPEFAAVMRRYYDFVVRYENVLSDLALVTRGEEQPALYVQGQESSLSGEAGKVWTITRSKPGVTTVSLINLLDAKGSDWNEPKPLVQPLHAVQVEIPVTEAIDHIFVASPDQEEGRPQLLPYALVQRDQHTYARVCLSTLHYWSTIVLVTKTTIDK